MSAYTPGPWTALPEECDRPYIRVCGSAFGGRCRIANVLTPVYEGVPDREAEETRANARLIAAAPDGLAAAETAYLALLSIQPSIWRLRNMEVYCALRDFIAQATGRDAESVQNEFEGRAAIAKAVQP